MNLKLSLDGKYELYDLVVNMFDKKTAVSYVKLHYNGTVITVYDKNSSENLAELIDITTKNYDYYFSLGGMRADAIEFCFVAGDSVDASAKQWLSIYDITCSAKTEDKIYGIADKKDLMEAIDYVDSFNFDAANAEKQDEITEMLADAVNAVTVMPSDFSVISSLVDRLNTSCEHVYGINNGECKLCNDVMLGVYAATVCLDDNISLYFYYRIDESFMNDTGAALIFTVNGRTIELLLSDGVKCNDGTYLFVCPLFVTEMTSTVTVQILLSNGEASASFEYSVKQYAEHVLQNTENNEAYAECADLVRAMLNFGGYAQAYTGRYSDDLANEGIEEAVIVTDFDSYEPVVTGTLPEGIRYYGMSVILDSYIHVKHYFAVEDGVDIPAGFVRSGDYYYVRVDGFSAVNYASVRTYTVGDWTINYSVLSYCYLANRNSPSIEMQRLISAIYTYYEQACLYKNIV